MNIKNKIFIYKLLLPINSYYMFPLEYTKKQKLYI